MELQEEFRTLLEESVGPERARTVADALSQQPSVSIRLNPSKLKACPFPEAAPVAWSPYGYLLKERPVFTLDPLFHAGCYYVQDTSAMFVGHIFRQLLDGLEPDATVLDLCAAPGGKTIQIAWRLRGEGRLVAQEVNESRLRRLKENLARLRMEWVETTSALPPPDAQAPEFDRVLADVPCSNTGVLRRRPDARWRWNVNHLNQLTALQGEILEAAAKRVAPGGLLVYSTCSNEPEENEGQISRFLDAHHKFSEVARRESLPFRTGHDGAFSCAMRRA